MADGKLNIGNTHVQFTCRTWAICMMSVGVQTLAVPLSELWFTTERVTKSSVGHADPVCLGAPRLVAAWVLLPQTNHNQTGIPFQSCLVPFSVGRHVPPSLYNLPAQPPPLPTFRKKISSVVDPHHQNALAPKPDSACSILSKACELASTTLSDGHTIPLPDGVSTAIHDIKKALQLIGLSIAGWEGIITSAREKLGNFVKKIIGPLAAERFSEFQPVMSRLSEQSAGHERLSKALTVLREALGAMVGVATSPQAADPLETALEAWAEWQKNKGTAEPSQKPFFEDLFVFGKNKTICSEDAKWQRTPDMQTVMDFLTHGRLSKLLSEVQRWGRGVDLPQ